MKYLNQVSIVLLVILISACTNNAPKYPKKIIQFDAEAAADLALKIRSEANVEVTNGLELSLWASDTLVKDPIAISVDPKGRIYYTSATRQTNSEFDIRGHRNWMTASISFQTVEERRDFIKKNFESGSEESEKFLKDLNEDGVRDWRDLAVEKEQVWIVSDESRNGVADQTQQYIEDFGDEITDVANGVEYAYGEVYISVGPDLWRTKDKDGDDIADEAESISHGYAVHVGFSGHGMSGVTMGPDGRIWWGIGDIGMNVIDKAGKHWKYPNRGVVVRSEPDGSNFEVFAMGVRNTHEFVFDKYGNLITEDNDGDHSGERERLVYLIDGSDTGWRINWQFGKYTDPDNNKYKVWMDEKMHIPRWDGQAAYFLPPIQNYVNGPTGMVYNPGTALSPEWYDHFFIAEFRGTPSNSPIHAFTMKPDGAGFALNETKEVVKGLLPTGLDFGPDGALYFGDWINGWGTKDQGRIWKLDATDQSNVAIRKETQTLIEADFSKKTIEDLQQLLGHQDMRVRTKAQFNLVKKGDKGFETLKATAKTSTNQLGRIHGLWGMGQMTRKDKDLAKSIAPFLKDKDVEIIAQTAKLIGDVRYDGANKDLQTLVNHSNPRVQFFAAEALGRIGDEKAITPILEMLEKNNDQDTWLRMGGMIALGRIGKVEPLVALKNNPSKALRTAAVVALRRIESPKIAEFLNDSDEFIAAEAARGINDDFSIEAALPALAKALKDTKFTGEPFLRRAINANLRIGKKENAQILLNYASNPNAPTTMRAEALAALNTWSKLSVFDRVDGRYRGEKSNNEADAKPIIIEKIDGLLNDKVAAIQVMAIHAVRKFQLKDKENQLMTFIKNSTSEDVRTAALIALNELNSSELDNALELALADKNDKVRSKALELLPNSKIDAESASTLYRNIIKVGTTQEQQTAIKALGNFNNEEIETLLLDLMKELQAGQLKPEIQLDLIETVSQKESAPLNAALGNYQKGKTPQNGLTAFTETLYGGNPRNGRNIFYYNETAQCTRCHAVFEYGGNAGPVLEGVGDRLTSEQLLSALVTPSAEYAAGYEVVLLELNSGKTVSGVLIEKTDQTTKIKIGNEDIQIIENSDIKSAESLPSSMIPVGEKLSKQQIRDLIAYLMTLKSET